MKFKIILIKEILFSPPTNSGLKKKHVEQKQLNSNYIPVYSASKDEKHIYGWVRKDSKWKKYENLLTWVKDGSSSGYVFYRKELFVPYEKLKILELKEEFRHNISYEYLQIVIQNKLLSNDYGFGFKCSMERVLETEIKVPVNQDEEYDLQVQLKLAETYNSVFNLKNKVSELFKEFDKIKIAIDFKKELENFSEFRISDFFKIVKGKSKYTQKYIRHNQGKYPVYSSQTINEGEIGKVNSFDYDLDCITWTTDGIYAGTVFIRTGRFSMTTHCGALLLKQKCQSFISLQYVYLYLFLYLKDYAIGEGNKRLTVQQMKSVTILFPVRGKNVVDLSEQKRIVDRYFKLHKITENLKTYFDDINEVLIEL